MNLTDFIIPALFVFVLCYGAAKKADVFSEFISGVKEGLETVLSIFPSLFCLVITVTAFRASGGAELLSEMLSPLLSYVGFPEECLPLAVLRPFSGSGALAVFSGILSDVGPDSRAGRIASVMMGSSETTFYTLSVYFSAVKAKKTGYALPAAVCGDIAGVIASTAAVTLLLS